MAQSLSGRSLTGFVRESRILPVGTRSRGFVQTRAADSKRAHWLPGTEFPKHLDGSLPGRACPGALSLPCDSLAKPLSTQPREYLELLIRTLRRPSW